MPSLIDITGQKFGRLTVVGRAPFGKSRGGEAFWSCSCDCGRRSTVSSYSLRRGFTKSCGCLNADVQRARIHLVRQEYDHCRCCGKSNHRDRNGKCSASYIAALDVIATGFNHCEAARRHGVTRQAIRRVVLRLQRAEAS